MILSEGRIIRMHLLSLRLVMKWVCYSGYWKVYGDLSEAKQLFYKFDRAKEALIELVSQGIGIRNVIESCSSNLLLDGAA